MRRALILIVIGLALPFAALAVTACQSPAKSDVTSDATTSAVLPPAEGSTTSMDAGVAVEPGGARLWEQNCIRCHTLRLPEERSDAEWEVIVHHMRVRANLTGQEGRAITRFLKAAN